MDFWSVVIVGSIVISGLVMIIGPVMELKGKILFLKPAHSPRISGRWGMGLMLVSFLLFVIGLVLRAVLSADVVTPIVLTSFTLWFVGGIAAVIRNEVLKVMLPVSESEQRGEVNNELSNF